MTDDLFVVGAHVWEKRHEGGDYEPRHGWIIALTTDHDDGYEDGVELARVVYMKTPKMAEFRWLKVENLNPDDVGPPYMASRIVRDLARIVGGGKDQLRPFDAELIGAITRLTSGIRP